MLPPVGDTPSPFCQIVYISGKKEIHQMLTDKNMEHYYLEYYYFQQFQCDAFIDVWKPCFAKDINNFRIWGWGCPKRG